MIVAEWRATLDQTPAPADRQKLVGALDSALLDVELTAGKLARVATAADKNQVAAVASQVDGATQRVEGAVGALGLQRCSALTIRLGQLQPAAVGR